MVYNLQGTEERKVFWRGRQLLRLYTVDGIYTNTNMEQSRNDTGSGEPKYWKKNLSQFHFVNNKSHIHFPRIQIWYSRLEAGN
jgi:hypothetical protein